MTSEALGLGADRALRKGVFLDRDGVLVEDKGLLVEPADIRILPGVPEALLRLHRAGFLLVVVSNQAVVARGLLDPAAVRDLHREVERRLEEAGAPHLDGFYFCPHHPRATLAAFRQDCQCRKPRPGLLLQAASELNADLGSSYLVGDRPTDILAGARAGCRTIWAKTGQHLADLIQTSEPWIDPPRADFECGGLADAAEWILQMESSAAATFPKHE